MDSLDHPAVLHVETGHDSYRFHGVHTSFQQGERVKVPKHRDEMTLGALDDEQVPNEVAVAPSNLRALMSPRWRTVNSKRKLDFPIYFYFL
jgi:hypothetical protein